MLHIDADSGTSLTVGVIVPETGQAAYLGRAIKAGIDKAIEDINTVCSSGGCLTVTAITRDSGSSSDEALQHFKELYSQGVCIFIGLVTSEEAKAVAQYASTNAPEALLFSPSSTATSLCEYKNLVRMTMDNSGLAEAIIDKLVEREMQPKDASFQQVVIPVVRNDAYGTGIARDLELKATSLSNPVHVLDPLIYDPSQIESFSQDLISELVSIITKETSPDDKVVVVLAAYSEGMSILEAASKHNYLKYGRTWVVTDSLALVNFHFHDEDITVLGFSYFGEEVTSPAINKQIEELYAHLYDRRVSPLPQAVLAYDALSYAYSNYTQSGWHITPLVGLSGTLDISTCNAREAGYYTGAVYGLNDDSLASVEGWIGIEKISVTQNSDVNYVHLQRALSSQEGMIHQLPEKLVASATSITGRPAVPIKKEDLVEVWKYVPDDCTSELVKVQHKDPISLQQKQRTYTTDSLPKTLLIPSEHGFTLEASCVSESAGGNYAFELRCPASGGAEMACIANVTSPQTARNQGNPTDAVLFCGAAALSCSALFLGLSKVEILALGIGGCIPAGAGCVWKVVEIIPKKGTYICTELYRQGVLSPEVYMADAAFAEKFSKEHPIVRKGYEIIAPPVVWLMQNSDIANELAKFFAVPWSHHMAYQQGLVNETNNLGVAVHTWGGALCGSIGLVYFAIHSSQFFTVAATMIIAAVLVKKGWKKEVKID